MDNWKCLYKIDYEHGHNVTTNMLYTPMVNPEGNIMCMIWDADNSYQHENINLSSELVDFFFNREVKHLKLMQNFLWAPKLIDIKDNKIFIEWNKESLNHILMSGRSLDKECPDWKEQIFNIVKDILNIGYYKVALYPHCFFLKDGIIKTIDFYSCVGIEERYIARENLNGMIGSESSDRFNLATIGDYVDFKKFFEITMTQHLGKNWIDNPFPEFYKRLT
jgi:hypothetical protein